MYENPGDELSFGEVYRQILQEAWLPEGAEEWMRLGKSRRGRRPTQRGIGAQSPTLSQAAVRRCFSLCADNWRRLPDVYAYDHPCAGFPGKQFWWDQKQERGVICSYYDLYMRYCLYFCLKISCPPEDIVCYKWDPESTKETIHGYWAGIYVIGGFAPYQWSVDDPNFWIQAVITSIPVNGITTREDVCGIANITVTDFCGRVVEGIVTTPHVPTPYFPLIWPDSNPQEIGQDASLNIQVEHGVPPFTWDATGDEFTLTHLKTQDHNNVLYASPTSCGPTFITVYDCLGTQVNASIRSTAGQWVQKSEGHCVLKGNGICIADCDTREQLYELIIGYQKQLQWTYCPITFGACWEGCDQKACAMDIILETFCAQVRAEYCLFAAKCTTCIDQNHQFCECVGGPGHPHRTWCVSNLKYYEWEC